MNRPNLLRVSSLALVILAATYTPAWAQAAGDSSTGAGAGAGQGKAPFAHRHMGQGQGRGKEFDSIRGVLTAEQKPKFEQILTQAMSEAKPMRQQLTQLQQSDTPDAKTQAKIDDLKAQMKAHHKQTHEKIMALLTQSQKDQLKSMREQGGGKRAATSTGPASAASSDSSDSMGGPDDK
jgi:hypothetical protein